MLIFFAGKVLLIESGGLKVVLVDSSADDYLNQVFLEFRLR